jgi:ubiquitin-conjugating enzyme E2 G1
MSGRKPNALLMKQLKQLSKNPPEGIYVGLVDDDIYEWQVMVEGPEGTLFEGGYFPARLSFPVEFPLKPPSMRFTTPGFWHPNIYPDGKVCISILHEHKEDKMNSQELMSEKWRPVLSVEAVLVSVLSMLDAPNFSSPANIDASVQCRNDPGAYKKQVKRIVRLSQEAL